MVPQLQFRGLTDYTLVFQCLTSKGRELTRIALVTEGGGCVLDELVKPDNKVLDYLTRYFTPGLLLFLELAD